MSGRTSWSIPFLCGGIFGALSTVASVGDSDLFWHLAQGRQTLSEGLARVDQFSWTVPGMPVLTDQWLGQVAWYGAYAGLGWTGIVLLRSLLVAGIATLIVAAALRAQPRPIVAVLAALPAVTLTRFAWTERPQLMGLFCFTLLLFLLRVAWERPRVLIAVPPLILLWANLHASFVLGLAVALIAMVILGIRRAELRTMLAVIAGASLAATLLTPSGAAIWTSASGHFLSPPRMVLEEGVPDVAQPYGVVFVLIILASLVTAALARPVPLSEVALMVPVLFVSMTAARHTPFFAVASAPYLAARGPEAVAAIAARLRIGPRLPALRASVPPVAVDVVTALLAIVAVVGGAATARATPNLDPYPLGALSSLPSGPGLLNDYDWGGFLIWYAPATPVFIDGRLFPYTGDALRDYDTVVAVGPTWREVLARRGIRTLLVKPGSPLAVRARDLGWSIVSEATRYVVFMVPNSLSARLD